MRSFHEPCHILALNTGLEPDQEQAILEQRLGTKRIIQLTGCWDGEQEQSYLVQADEQDILNLAREYEQKSVLFLDAARSAYLINCDKPAGTDPEYIGEFLPKPELIAKRADSWTCSSETGTYYVVQ